MITEETEKPRPDDIHFYFYFMVMFDSVTKEIRTFCVFVLEILIRANN